MKQTIKQLSLLLLLFLFFTSCKKYPEGPSFSLKTKASRLCGSWAIEKYLYNSGDSTAAFNTAYPGYVRTIERNRTYKIDVTAGGADYGNWEFDDKKEHVLFESTKQGINGFDTIKYSWEILKLEKDALWLRRTDNGIVGEIHYKPK